MATRLIAKVMDGLASCPGSNAAVVLCDENGDMLPGQVGSVLETGTDKIARLTVTFELLGDDITLEGSAHYVDPMARPWPVKE